MYSFYGASDLDINIAFETDFEVALRKALMKNPALAKSLFGSHPFVPMVFHYDPLANFIETDPNGNLLFTNVEGNRISPRIRYDLGDKGQIMKMSEVQAKLKELGIDLGVTPRTNLPMLFVWGRIDSYITYRGANVSPENLDEALQKTGLSPIVRNYGFRQYEENGTTQTEMMIELAEGKRAAEIRRRRPARLARRNAQSEYRPERADARRPVPMRSRACVFSRATARWRNTAATIPVTNGNTFSWAATSRISTHLTAADAR